MDYVTGDEKHVDEFNARYRIFAFYTGMRGEIRDGGQYIKNILAEQYAEGYELAGMNNQIMVFKKANASINHNYHYHYHPVKGESDAYYSVNFPPQADFKFDMPTTSMPRAIGDWNDIEEIKPEHRERVLVWFHIPVEFTPHTFFGGDMPQFAIYNADADRFIVLNVEGYNGPDAEARFWMRLPKSPYEIDEE